MHEAKQRTSGELTRLTSSNSNNNKSKKVRRLKFWAIIELETLLDLRYSVKTTKNYTLRATLDQPWSKDYLCNFPEKA